MLSRRPALLSGLLAALAPAATRAAVVGPETPLDVPILGPAAGSRYTPVLGHVGDDFLAVWNDGRESLDAIYMGRFAADGTVLDPTGVELVPPAGLGTNDIYLSCDDECLVAWIWHA